MPYKEPQSDLKFMIKVAAILIIVALVIYFIFINLPGSP